ncbi:MAG: hypothetical protein ACRDZR_02245 [Acidimicrobiales bacterium]
MTGRILPPDHPLDAVFSIGRRSGRDIRELAAEVVGFRIGDRVRCERTAPARGSWDRYAGRAGRVVGINPADGEVGLSFGESEGVEAWFVPDELRRVTAPTRGPGAPLAASPAPGTRDPS